MSDAAIRYSGSRTDCGMDLPSQAPAIIPRSILELPDEVLFQIFCELDSSSLIRVRRVCCRFRRLALLPSVYRSQTVELGSVQEIGERRSNLMALRWWPCFKELKLTGYLPLPVILSCNACFQQLTIVDWRYGLDHGQDSTATLISLLQYAQQSLRTISLQNLTLPVWNFIVGNMSNVTLLVGGHILLHESGAKQKKLTLSHCAEYAMKAVLQYHSETLEDLTIDVGTCVCIFHVEILVDNCPNLKSLQLSNEFVKAEGNDFLELFEEAKVQRLFLIEQGLK